MISFCNCIKSCKKRSNKSFDQTTIDLEVKHDNCDDLNLTHMHSNPFQNKVLNCTDMRRAIFSFLDICSLVKTDLVCMQWNAYAKNPASVSSICFHLADCYKYKFINSINPYPRRSKAPIEEYMPIGSLKRFYQIKEIIVDSRDLDHGISLGRHVSNYCECQDQEIFHLVKRKKNQQLAYRKLQHGRLFGTLSAEFKQLKKIDIRLNTSIIQFCYILRRMLINNKKHITHLKVSWNKNLNRDDYTIYATVDEVLSGIKHCNQLTSLELKSIKLLYKPMFGNLSCLKILRLVGIRYNLRHFWQNLSLVCRQNQRSLVNLVEFVLLGLEDETYYNSKSIARVKQYVITVAQRMIKLETFVIYVTRHVIIDNFICRVAKCPSAEIQQLTNSKISHTAVTTICGLKYLRCLYNSQTRRLVDRLKSYSFKNLKCLMVEAEWNSNFSPFSFFNVIDKCRINVYNDRNFKVFIKVKCLMNLWTVQDITMTNIEKIRNIFEDWYLNGLFDVSVSVYKPRARNQQNHALDQLNQSLKNLDSKLRSLKIRLDSKKLDSLRERVLGDCDRNETCEISPLLTRYPGNMRNNVDTNADLMGVDTNLTCMKHCRKLILIQNAIINKAFGDRMYDSISRWW